MAKHIEIPDDENGDVLKRMQADGDDLTKSRIIDFSFAFPERHQALAFAEMVDDHDVELCIFYDEEEETWQAIVKRDMIPSHREITALESSLAAKAASAG